ncbi:MAG: fatty-acid oxidation protein subunit alpha [Blastochloris sp.]|nr:fatty-acid oxidation protein subunit alpha [Blastochloris sp.]
MAARDVYHQAVKEGLMKDQWRITDDPLLLQVGGVDLYVDLGAEKLLAAEKDEQRIAVEVKSFLGPSLVQDFHLALGQFLNYRLALAARNSERKLYLAVPIETYATFFALPFIQSAVAQHHLSLLIYDSEQKEVVQWIN